MNAYARKKILAALKKGGRISGEILAASLGVTRADVNKHIKKLRAAGCVVSGAKKSGYILESLPPAPSFENLEIYLADEIPDLTFVNLARVDSTQTRIKALAEKGAGEWLVVRAAEQSGGYGRMRRKWESSPGGLWFSVLLRPRLVPQSAPAFSPAVSLAVRSAAERFSGAECLVKWPNDVLAVDGKGNLKKIAGIITEMSADSQEVRWLAVGCGINIENKLPRDDTAAFPAASLVEISDGRRIESAALLAALLVEIKKTLADYMNGGFARFAAQYNRHHALAGRTVVVESAGEFLDGSVDKVDSQGRLALKIRSGSGVRKILSGDVSVRKISG